jgi:hypothetical protein
MGLLDMDYESKVIIEYVNASGVTVTKPLVVKLLGDNWKVHE